MPRGRAARSYEKFKRRKIELIIKSAPPLPTESFSCIFGFFDVLCLVPSFVGVLHMLFGGSDPTTGDSSALLPGVHAQKYIIGDQFMSGAFNISRSSISCSSPNAPCGFNLETGCFMGKRCPPVVIFEGDMSGTIEMSDCDVGVMYSTYLPAEKIYLYQLISSTFQYIDYMHSENSVSDSFSKGSLDCCSTYLRRLVFLLLVY
ncbi:unnamed protein product [Amoebophrya sp. A120]|nr:unnamed protein product [Amoebophrya sp. A120]|eukprot:GSA120T00018006001.1